MVQRIKIARPVDLVRSQFADVAYHAAKGMHRGVTFLVDQEPGDNARTSRSPKSVRCGLRQRFLLDRTDPATQVNTVTAGAFAGGALTVAIDAEG